MLENLKEYYRKSDGTSKKKITGCIFAEKLDEWLRAQSSEQRALCDCEKTERVWSLQILGTSSLRSSSRSHTRSVLVPRTFISCNQFMIIHSFEMYVQTSFLPLQ